MQGSEERGFELFDQGRVAEAKNIAQNLLERNENDVSARCLMAAVLVEQDELEQALAELDKAVTVDPEDVRVRIQSAEVHLFSQCPERALEEAVVAMDCAGDEVDLIDAVLLKAAAEIELERRDEAVLSLRELEGYFTDEPPLLLREGDLWFELEEWERALHAFSAAAEIEPELADAHYGKGCAFAELADDERAVAEWQRTLELDQKVPLSPEEDAQASLLIIALRDQFGEEISVRVEEWPARELVASGVDPRSPYWFEDVVILYKCNLIATVSAEECSELAAEVSQEVSAVAAQQLPEVCS